MTTIDFDKPVDRIEDVLFDVELQKLIAVPPSSSNSQNSIGKEIPKYKLVCKKESGQVISIVSNNYRLIPNKEALKMGIDVFKQLFPSFDEKELIPFRIIAPKTLSSVNIDLIHKDVNFNVWEQETWLPFIRITNSYNRTHALSFEVGFVKKLCSNGVLFNKKTMKLKYTHDKNKNINVMSDAKQIFSFSNLFGVKCNKLREFKIPHDDMFPLLCQILKISLKIPEKRPIHSKVKNLEKLKQFVSERIESYQENNELNAYTAFNVATDLVSHNDKYDVLPGYYFNVRSFFTRPTDWMESFSEEISENDFNLNEYLKPTLESLNDLKTLTGFKWN
jgi:hypothetical protein